MEAFGAYCRRMSTADHVDDCPSLAPPARPVWDLGDEGAVALAGFTPSPPPCSGCVTSADRELWALLADEIEGHLADERHDVSLF